MISEFTIQSVKAATTVYDVVQNFVKLKKSGSDYEGLCPFHSEKTPSFKVVPAKNFYKCFGCGRSGDSISFLIEHEKLSYLECISWLGKRYGIEVEEEGKKEYVKPIPRLEKLGKKALEFFEMERHISNNTLLRFGITEAMEWMPQFKKEITVVCFNYLRDGNLINIKFRGPQKSFKLAKYGELIFYNLDAIKGERTCVIVEGEIDCLSMYEAGIYNVVSVPNGAGAGNMRLEYLDNCYEYFVNMEKIVLAVDNDEPGRRLREELCRRLGTERCYQVEYPEGCKDANDVLKLGKSVLADVVESARQWPIEGIVTGEDYNPDVLEFYENGYPKGLKTHIPGFDEFLTFYPGQLTIITGIPGSGKSEYVDYIMTSLTKFHGWSFGVCSFENPAAFHVTKLAEKITGKAFDFRKDSINRMNRLQFDSALSQINKNYHFINFSLVDVTMDGLLKKAEELVKRKGINGLLFDPWNCIEAKYGENETETKYVLSCLNKLINFLEKYKVHGFLVAHPTKLGKDKQTGKYEIPTLYSISGSAHFFNRTHNGISLYRDFQSDVVDVYVQKVKWSWLGKLGFCSFKYNTLTRQYVSEATEPETTGWKAVSMYD
jgi:twinkle protein